MQKINASEYGGEIKSQTVDTHNEMELTDDQFDLNNDSQMGSVETSAVGTTKRSNSDHVR